MTARPPIYGLLAQFETPEALAEAVRRSRSAGYTRLDAYTPYPVKEVTEALGIRRTAVAAVIFVGGLVGCVGGFFMQYWCMVIDYPINVGGRPFNSWPAFIPVTFEMTVLTAAVTGLLGLLDLCGLPAFYHPVFNVPGFALASRDRFFLCVEATDPNFDRTATREFLSGLQPLEVAEVPH
jgi:hypothetical protein